jgi:hypothetical protein
MQYLDPREGWDWFVRKTRRTAFIFPDVVTDRRPDRIVLRRSRQHKIGGGTAMVILGIGTLAAARGADGLWVWFLPAIGVLLVLGGLYAFACSGHVMWDPYGRTLTLCLGTWPLLRAIELRRDRLQVDLSLGRGKSSFSNLTEGRTVLSLSCEGRPGKVHVAAVAQRAEVQEACDLLSTFLESPVEDATHVTMALPDGTALEVAASPLVGRSSVAEQLTLRFPSPDVAAFGSEAEKSFLSFLLPTIASFIAFGLVMAVLAGGGFAMLALPVGGIALPVLGLLAVLRLSRRSIVADRGTGRISLRGRALSGQTARDIPFADIAAVQVCDAPNRGTEDSRMLHEINLVLRTPPGERVNLVCSPEGDSVKSDACQLAEFLGVPLWDHSRYPSEEDVDGSDHRRVRPPEQRG